MKNTSKAIKYHTFYPIMHDRCTIGKKIMPITQLIIVIE